MTTLLSTRINLRKSKVDSFKRKFTIKQRIYKYLFPKRWEIKEKIRNYELRCITRNLRGHVDSFLAWGDSMEFQNGPVAIETGEGIQPEELNAAGDYLATFEHATRALRENHEPEQTGISIGFRDFLFEKGKLPLLEEFKINDLITLKLEGRFSNIYVKGRKFKQCKFLLLNLEKGKEYKEIESIDEAAEKLGAELVDLNEVSVNIDETKPNYNSNMERNRGKYSIPPETEFWGHCSNLQAWAENDYDLRVIHTNLGFPLVCKLIEYGDKKALSALKEEVSHRIIKGGSNSFITLKKYLIHFTKEEQGTLIEEIIEKNRDFAKTIMFKVFPNPNQTPHRTSYQILGPIHGEMIQSNSIPAIILNLPILITMPPHAVYFINGGIGENNDMTQMGDFIHTLGVVRQMIHDQGFNIVRIDIISSIHVFRAAWGENHFVGNLGITEHDRILKYEFVSSWNHMNIPNEMYFIVTTRFSETIIFKTGELTL